MNKINYEDFKNICRVCMSNYCDINFNKNSVMLDVFYKLTDVQFETNDELPQQICLKCVYFMNEIHSFSMACKQTHSVLMKCLNDYKNNRTKEEQEIAEETNEQINIKDEITIEEHKFELDNDWELNEEMDIKDEIKIEEHKIEFIKDEFDNDCETNDVLNEDVPERTNDLLSPLKIKIHTENEKDQISDRPSVSELSNNMNRHYKCDDCEKTFRYSRNLIRHKRVHSGKKPYKCDQCEKSFDQSNNLTMHKRVHSRERPYQCDQCEKSFAGLGNLIRHKLVHRHSGKKSYKCDQCEKLFTYSSTLKCHKRVHTGERPYKCDQCEKSFTHLHSLHIHKRVHSGERPYQCAQCEKSFTQLSHLKVHKRVHTGARPFLM